MSPELVVCAACGAAAGPGARFCEACGGDLPAGGQVVAPTGGAGSVDGAAPGPGGAVSTDAPVPGHAELSPEGAAPCRECGGAVDPDGYCTQCGAKAPRPRDHMVEAPQAWVGGVSDRGVRHHRNEDAMSTAADVVPGDRAVLVVCDGVSSSQDSDVASLAAARAARTVLLDGRAVGMGTDDGLVAVIGARIAAATDAAAQAVEGATSPDHGDSPPSCTFVAAVVEAGHVVVGVVGDSRAYWMPDTGAPRALTEDDSWAAEQIAAGASRAAAESGAQAHAITRWLGVDAPDHAPRLTDMVVDAPGWLLLCSDGLWNYASEADALAAVVRQAAQGRDGAPVAIAEALVAWANAQGGHDNITVVLARLGGAAALPAAPPAAVPSTAVPAAVPATTTDGGSTR